MKTENCEFDVLLDFRTAVIKKPESEGTGIIYTKNLCCSWRPVIITEETKNGEKVYTAQCACGDMRTSGCKSASAALRKWERATLNMCREPHLYFQKVRARA